MYHSLIFFWITGHIYRSPYIMHNKYMFFDKRFRAAVIDADQTPKQVAGFSRPGWVVRLL